MSSDLSKKEKTSTFFVPFFKRSLLGKNLKILLNLALNQ